MEDNKKKKRIFRIIVTIAIIIPIVLAISYAYFQAVITGEDAGVRGKSTNTFEINLVTENDGYINASNLLLIKAEDVEEEAQKGYFKVVSGNNKHYVTYTLSLSELTVSANLQVTDFKWQLLKNSEQVANGTFNGISTNSMNLVTGLQIGANKSEEYELRIWIEETEYDQLSLMNGTFAGKVTLTADMNQNPIPPTLAELILEQGGGASAIEAKGSPNFAQIATIADTGLYASDDEYGTSYYYRGVRESLNNNLIFGGFQWKIVRINGDGSVRIIYNGTEAQFNTNGTMNTTGNNTSIGTGAWNITNYNDAKYVGYMYGGANGVTSTVRNGTVSNAATYNETNSNAKTQLDAWYQTNIAGKSFESKIVDNLFCNDRQLVNEIGGPATGPGYGNTGTTTYYGAYYRLLTNKTPTLKCGLKNDRFTKNDVTLGNGTLNYPIGLITADEGAIAGLVYGMNNNTNYLYTNQNNWASTPHYMYSTGDARVWNVNSLGNLTNHVVSGELGLRSVLNLGHNVIVSGDGSATNPYRVNN